MLDDHPAIRNAALIVGFISLVGGAGGIIWNIYAESERSADQTHRLERIEAKQVDIRRDIADIERGMALQTSDIEEVRETQGTIVHHFERVEDGQQRLSEQVQQSSIAQAVELGRLLERTEQKDQSREP